MENATPERHRCDSMKPGAKPLALSNATAASYLKRAPGAHEGNRQAHHFAYVTYLVFAAFASAATAVFESCCEFMNFVTTSEIAPAAASGCAMPCASEGT